jgi:methionyl-tRNA formyltransferase
MSRLKLAFMGTPDFACPALEALIAAGHEIAAVYCQPPRPAGRGQRPRASPVQRLAERRGLPVRMPARLKNETEQAAFRTLGLDAAVVVAYGLILPEAVLEAPRLGCLNIHASLLPRWRGAAPIQRAILAGDAETGITIMQMDQGLDTGPILMQEAVPIGIADTAADLHDRLAALGARMIVAALAGLAAGKLVAQPQPADGATYAAKIDRAEARIDWRETAAMIERRLRAFTPWPGLWFEAKGERLRLVGAHLLPDAPAGAVAPGTVLQPREGAPLAVACGEGTALALDSLQRAGRAARPAAEFLRGFALEPGARLS